MKDKRRIITEEPEELLHRYGDDILQSESFQKMKNYNHHRHSNTYAHCIAVTLRALAYCKRKKKKVDPEALVRGCLLHDYYLYNHRTSERIKWHLFRHPLFAARNAKRDFNVDKTVEHMIKSHMWPLTPFHIPACRESWILMNADKAVSYWERFPKRAAKREAKLKKKAGL